MTLTGPAHSRRAGAVYPFSAIVGQGPMKLALVLCALDPGLGGVLLRGEKGTAKSTAARGLGLLANMPFVELPLGAGEDRLLGALDIEAAVQKGRAELKSGLLAAAHGGMLYVDEVNLLPAHLAHLVLDAAASGVVRIEREGLSARAPARFALVASMNPEEGPIGPQLLDRFGLCVKVSAEPDPALRKEILTRRLAFEVDPHGFAEARAADQAALAERLQKARRALASVMASPRAQARAAHLAAEAGCQGQRGELALIRAARALAAWQGMAGAGPELVDELAQMALAHRTGAGINDQPQPENRLRDAPPQEPDQKAPPKVMRVDQISGEDAPPQARATDERTLYILAPGQVTPVATRMRAKEGGSRKQAGRRRASEAAGERGRYLRASPQRLGRPLAFDATFRAAAPHQKARRAPGGPLLVVKGHDIHEKVRAARRGRMLLFCVDASGSMNAAARMQTTKAAILGLLTEAYQKRDRVGLIAFGGTGAIEVLPPTGSVEVARRRLSELPTGGKTPLAAGMVLAAQVLQRELTQDPNLTPLVVILTDGRPNVPLAAWQDHAWSDGRAGNKGGGWGDRWGDGGYADREVLNLARQMALDSRPNFVVVDTDTHNVHEINLCRPLADYLGASCVSLGRLTADGVLDLVRKHW